jgi:hypothetical protein
MTEAMSEYEARAWQKLIAAERTRRKTLRARASDKVAVAVSNAGAAAKRIPGAVAVSDSMDVAMKVALSATAKGIFIPAVASVSIARRTKRLRKRHPDIGNDDPFKALDLRDLDKGRPRQVIPLMNAATSAGASLAITGAEVSAAVSGGATAGVVILAIAGDIGTSLAFLGRSVAEVAVHYGFDPSEPDEEIFLMGVLSFSTAASLQGKTAALAALSRLSQQMMRRATWKQLEKDVMVKVIQSVFSKIGIKLTHKRLAQLVPVLGGIVSAGLSYDMQNQALGDATRIYRARYLAEKHGLSFDDWVKQAAGEAPPESGAEGDLADEPIEVDIELQQAISEYSESEDSELEPPA